MLELTQLAAELWEAKRREADAKKYRIATEESIAAIVETPDSGQKTVKLNDGSKVTVKRGWNYKANLADIKKLFIKWNDNACMPIKTKEEFDAAGYEWYRVHDPEGFREISKHVIATPKKVAVTLQEPKTDG